MDSSDYQVPGTYMWDAMHVARDAEGQSPELQSPPKPSRHVAWPRPRSHYLQRCLASTGCGQGTTASIIGTITTGIIIIYQYYYYYHCYYVLLSFLFLMLFNRTPEVTG